jgi:adenine-specific DNA-methyltransferase
MKKMDGDRMENGELRMEKLNGKSKDIAAENIAKLKELFPEAFTEGKVDFDALKEVLGTFVDDRDERYSFTWNGKSKARMIAQTPSTGTLRPCKEESVDWDSTQNIFIEGDNLEVLKLLQKSYHKKVKMIFIDPPYNTGKDFVYKDDFRDNIKNYKLITGQLDGEGRNLSNNPETSGRYHTDWLNMMYPRLKLARNLLKDDGAIFIVIDDVEVSNLKKICDEIFGEENIIAHVIWQHSVQPKGYTDIFSVHHNHILGYRKSEAYKIHALPRTEQDNKNYSNPDNDPNGDWRSGDVRNALYRPNLIYDIVTPSGKVISPPENGWRWSKETVQEKISTGEILFSDDETRIIRKIYLANQTGRAPETIWFGKDVGVTRDGANQLKALFDGKAPFDTVKPIGLIQRVMQVAGVAEEDIVLDFFAGSCSAAHAVLDSKNGHFVAVQIPERVDDSLPSGKIVKELNLPNIAEVGKERIRRAIAKLKEDNPLFAGDLGFKVFKLDSTNIKPWEVDFDMTGRTLEDFISNIKTERREEDVLYEILLKYGLDLTLPITEHAIAGQKVFDIGMGALIICLSDAISLEVVEGIVLLVKQLKPEYKDEKKMELVTRVVFKDSGFAGDVVKTNAVQILKQAGIVDVKSL